MSERVVSDEQLAEWEALAQAATDGPWEFWNADDGDEHEISIRAGEAVSSPGAYKSTDLITEDEIGHMWRSETTAGPDVEQRVSDFEFIAAARSAVPALIRALRDARDDIERIHAAWCDVIQREQRSDNAHYYDMTQLRAERDSLRDENRRLHSHLAEILAKHSRYRAPAEGRFDCCAECSRGSVSYVPYPCQVRIDIGAALAAPTGDRQDWTADANGRSNSSDTFVAIVAIVARLLRSEMWSITQDDAGRESAARLIVAQLAHKHGFAPVAAPTGQEQSR